MNKALNFLMYVSGALVLLISAYKWPVYFIFGLMTTIYLVVKYLDHDLAKAVRKSKAFGIFERLVVGFFTRTAPWLLLMWLTISFAINWIFAHLFEPKTVLNFEEAILGVKLIAFVASCGGLTVAKKIYVYVEANHNSVYQGFFTGWRYPNAAGFGWVSPFSSLKFDVPTDRHLEVTVEDNAPAAGGQDTMPYKARVLFRVGTDNESVRRYTETTEGNIKAALALRTGVVVSTYLWNADTPRDAKAKRNNCFNENSFETECDRYGLVVEAAELPDLDFSEDVAKSEKAKGQVAGYRSAKQALLDDDPTMDPKEADRIVKALLLGGNYKQVEVTGNGSNNAHPMFNT